MRKRSRESFDKALRAELRRIKPEYMELSFRQGSEGSESIFNVPGVLTVNIPFDTAWDSYQKGTPVKRAAELMLEAFTSTLADRSNILAWKDRLNDKEYVRKNLFASVFNAEQSRKTLKGVPYRIIEDLAIVPTVYVETQASGGRGIITRDKLQEWGLSDDEFIDEAIRNSEKLLPPMEIPMDALAEDDKEPDPRNGIVITNEKQKYGASVVFYPGYLDGFCELFGDDLFVMMSSVNDAIVVPADRDIRMLYEAVKAGNSQLPPEEILSESVYRYSRGKSLVKVADPADLSPSKDEMDAILRDYDLAKKRLMIEALSAEENREYLNTVPHRIVGEIAIVPVIIALERESGLGICKPKNSALKQWGVSADTLVADAIRNSSEFMGPKHAALDGTWPEGSRHSGDLKDGFIVTNRRDHYGASVIFYPGYLDKYCRRFDDDLFVLPYSMDEAVIVPVKGRSANDFLPVLSDLIQTCRPERKLSSSVFRYSIGKGLVKAAPVRILF